MNINQCLLYPFRGRVVCDGSNKCTGAIAWLKSASQKDQVKKGQDEKGQDEPQTNGEEEQTYKPA
jgi:hypothetical protein